MADLQAISVDDISGIGIGVIAVLLILGIVLVFLLTQIVVRIVVAVVVVALAVLVWQQRGHVQDEIEKHCKTDTTFFGIHVDVPDDVRKACSSK